MGTLTKLKAAHDDPIRLKRLAHKARYCAASQQHIVQHDQLLPPVVGNASDQKSEVVIGKNHLARHKSRVL